MPTPRSVLSRRSAACATTGMALGFGLALTACPSGKSVRGVVHPGTAQPNAGDVEGSPTCRGPDVDAWAPKGFCVKRFATDLDRPRHLAFAPNGDLLVATRKGVVVLWDADGNGASDRHERGMLDHPDVSHQGIALAPDGRWLYLADSREVRRLPFHAGQRADEGKAEVVVRDVPLTVDHPYRTITFDAQGRLYLAVGADDNLTAGRGAAIVRFTLPGAIPAGGIRYDDGERFAVGIRNPEALAWAPDGALWAFVNGRDFLRPPGTPEGFYLDHPGDWVFRLSDRAGTFYGFPTCWVLGPSPWGDRKDPRSQWVDREADDRVDGGTRHDDAWCQNAANVHPAAGALPAHSAPLGAVAYTGRLFPPRYQNAFFVSSHGSWNRHGRQRGRTLLAVHVDESGRGVKEVETVLGERGSGGDLEEGSWKHRPVGVVQGPDGALYVTSDESGDVLRVGYRGE